MDRQILLHNERLINLLHKNVRHLATMWMDDCIAMGFDFLIVESYRSQARQDELYQQGRTKQGPTVTWTKRSLHTLGLALDIAPLNCKHEALARLAVKYGLKHPLPRQDPPHYEWPLEYAQNGPESPLGEAQKELSHLSPPARLRTLLRAISRTVPPLKDALARQYERLRKRISGV